MIMELVAQGWSFVFSEWMYNSLKGNRESRVLSLVLTHLACLPTAWNKTTFARHADLVWNVHTSG